MRTGKYYSFGSLVVSYGGWDWPPAIKAAERHALRCAILGGDWIQTDSEFSGLVHFCKMEIEFSKVHEQAWQLHTQWSNGQEPTPVENDDGGGGGGGSSSGNKISNPAPDADTPKLAKEKPKAKAKGKAALQAGKDSPKPAADDLQKELQAANEVKAAYGRVELKARRLLDQIKSNVAYADLDNDQNKGVLQKLYDDLAEGMSTFDTEFCLEDFKTIKGKYTHAALKTKLAKFVKLDFKALQDFTATAMRRHNA